MLQEKTLTEGPIGKSLVRFALPVAVSMLASQFYSVADSMIIGLMLDENALAAVSNASTILMIFLFVSGGMELGGNLLVAAKKPVYSEEKMCELCYTLLFVDLLLGVGMLVLGAVAFTPLLRLIQTPEEIVQAAALYGVFYLLGLPFQMLYDLAKQIMIGYGDSRTPLWYVLFTSVFNIVLDIVLVALMGIAGAAIASALAQVVGCVLIFRKLRRTVLAERFHFRMLRGQYARDIGRLAPPNMLQQMSGTVVSVVKQSFLGGFGVAAIAGFSSAGKISTLLQIPVYGAAQALVTFIAQNSALGQHARIRRGVSITYRLLFGLTAVLVLACVTLNRPMLRLFTDDAETIRYGAMILTYEPFAYFLSAVRHIQEAQLRGRQKMLRYLTSSISTMAVNILACGVLVSVIGYAGFYVSTYISAGYGIVLSKVLVMTLPDVRRGASRAEMEEHPFA